jgi:hypothetical protein
MGVTTFPQQGTIGANLLPKRYDIKIYQGDTFRFTLVLKDALDELVNLTGYTGKAQFRASIGSSLVQELSVTFPTPANGEVVISLTAAQTNNIPGGSYKWDLELTDASSNVRTLIGGIVEVIEDITEVDA